MPHGTKHDRLCPCGRGTIPAWKWNQGRHYCRVCGIERSVTAALEMSQRRGVAYERWQRSNASGATGRPPDSEG